MPGSVDDPGVGRSEPAGGPLGHSDIADPLERRDDSRVECPGGDPRRPVRRDQRPDEHAGEILDGLRGAPIEGRQHAVLAEPGHREVDVPKDLLDDCPRPVRVRVRARECQAQRGRERATGSNDERARVRPGHPPEAVVVACTAGADPPLTFRLTDGSFTLVGSDDALPLISVTTVASSPNLASIVANPAPLTRYASAAAA